ncbi:MAG: cytochrome C oxidase subunit IV family protein [Hydrogenophaga sp.]|uniref:cytochrome C oxidase subunit IV family protein n=1 Tax=Hydrogenophaga sp. TaxID=1904254 RepID=UPI0025BC794C|nr:cytochrome C oxidase subunit IV family protein [Hydrogenophaga sp.]MBT9550196.1 cytochrome C oxidase subunit IV family protein [Hydrogenophaga sp.]
MRLTRVDAVFALLAVATLASGWLGEGAAVSGQHLGAAATLAVLALAAFKGALIALDYMELRTAPALWRRLVMGWLVVVIGLVLLASLLLRA